MRIRWREQSRNRSPETTLQVSLDYNIQEYAQQAAEKVMEEKQADAVVNSDLESKNRGNLCLRQYSGV